MNKDAKVYVAGHTGLLGSALLRRLVAKGYCNVITRSHSELELTDQKDVMDFFLNEKPDYVFLAAGKVGGIVANKTYCADFLHINSTIQNNVFAAANTCNVKNLVFYGSSCVYPKHCEQPMTEAHFLTGPIEETSEAYASAKIAGIIGCKAYNIQYQTNRFIALIPNSIYGPHDNFDILNAHVLSSFIAKFHMAVMQGAKVVELWGTGFPRREFVYNEDVADASIFAMQHPERFDNCHYNVGSGSDLLIKDLAEKIAEIVGFSGDIIWDKTKPDGAPRKLLDSARIRATGWRTRVSLEEGLMLTYRWFLDSFFNH